MRKREKIWGLAVLAGLLAGTANGLTAYSYVQKGLKASYDGIDNAGTGTHDATVRTWKDLTGNENDGTLASSVGWAENAWTNQAQGKPVAVGTGLSAVTGTRTFTVDFCVTPARSNTRETFFGQYNAANAFAIEHNSGSGTKEGWIRLYGLAARPSGSGNYDWLSTVKIGAGEWASVSVTVSPSRQVIWKNGVPGATNEVAIATLSRTCNSTIGGELQRDSMGFFGSYHAFRLYNRVLTDDEIAVNAAIDAIRFHGASAGDFTLSGGYSFDAEGELMVDVTAIAQSGGKVRTGEDAAAASAVAAVRQDGTTLAIFTAVPDEGYEFVAWQLEDGATLASGTLGDATIGVSAKWPLAVTAVFRESGRLTAHSYVQKGLVACWDGIDNAGTGTHSSETRTWKDLTGNGYDGTLGPSVTWAANGWQNEAAEKPVALGIPISSVFAPREFTLEFTATPSRAPCRELFFGSFNWDSFAINFERKANGRLRCHYNNGEVDFESTSAIGQNETASFTVTTTPGKQVVWKNGVKDKEQTAKTITILSGGKPTYIGAENVDVNDNTRKHFNFRGTYHACRVYDRALTDAEIAVNNAVDAIRYRGASASDFTLSGGYSFDASGNLLVSLSVTATAGGQVRAGTGAAAFAMQVTVSQDGSAPAYFTAVPDAGYEFVMWNVDDGGMFLDGAPTDLTVGIASRWPVGITAVFRPARGAFPSTENADYVKGGLVAWYDGVDNAGVGQHGDSLSAWADLSGNGNHATVNSDSLGWTANACTNNVNGREPYDAGLFKLGSAVGETIAARAFTLEMALRPNFVKTRKVFFGSFGHGVGFNLEETAAGMFRIFYNDRPNVVTTVPVVEGEDVVLSVVSAADGVCVYKNGVPVYRYTGAIDPAGTISAALATSTYYLGGEMERDAYTYRGAIYAFRLYNRSLAPDEVRRNALLDRQRLFTRATLWTGASGTSWLDASNWSDGTPNPLVPAFLVQGGANLQLTQPAPAAGSISLGDGAASSTLAVGNGGVLPVADNSLAIGPGGALRVDAGGTLDVNGAGDNPVPLLSVADGGRLSVNGGAMKLRNFPSSLAVFGDEGRTGTLAIASGRLDVAVTASAQHGLSVLRGGRLEMTGGTLTFNRPSHTEGTGVMLNGGEVDLSGNATLVAHRTGLRLGPGEFRMTDTSRIRFCADDVTAITQFRIRGDVGRETVMTVEDAATIVRDDGDRLNFYIGDSIAGARAVLNWNSTGTLDARSSLAIGFRHGYGELNIFRGQVIGGSTGARVGQGTFEPDAGNYPTGVVNVIGGSLRNMSVKNGADTFQGLIVGAGNCVVLSNPGFYRGTLNVYGGAVTNSSEYFGIGIGFAEGDVNQYAGEVIHSGNQNEFVIGAFGGKGSMVMEGGRAWSKSAVYVGGVTTNNLYYNRNQLYTRCPVDNHCATGLLRVTNGRFDSANTIWVSQDGQGTLEIGPAGAVSANNVILTNTPAALTGAGDLAAKLKFTLGESGAGSLTVTNKLTIGQGVTLEVDATGLNGKSGMFPLVRFGESEGEFGDVTIQGQGHVMKTTLDGVTGYWYQNSPGTMMLFR